MAAPAGMPRTRSSSQDSLASGTLLLSGSDDSGDEGGGGGHARVRPEDAVAAVAAVAAPLPWQPTGVRFDDLSSSGSDGGGDGVSVTLDGREVALFRHGDAVYAVDGMCYHAGGPLASGRLLEIEELDRRPCVVCPWHAYMIMLDSGEGIYRHVELTAAGPAPRGVVPGCYKSKGRKQRVHPVRVVNGMVEVALSSSGDPPRDAFPYASDYYASDTYKRLMDRTRRTQPPTIPPPDDS